MYLHMASNFEEIAFLPFLAFFTLASEVKENANPYIDEGDDEEDTEKKKIKKLKSIMWMSPAEKASLQALIFEMFIKLGNVEEEEKLSLAQSTEDLIDLATGIFLETSETTSEKILCNQEMRALLIKDATASLYKKMEEETSEPSPETKKIILFELIHMTNAEKNPSQAKIDIIEYIGELFGLDNAYITEATKISKNMHALKKEGLSLFL